MTTHVHLVLASGGMRCVSYVGAVTALADHGVEVNTVSACSAGSFIGALLSAGMSAHEVQDCILVLDVVWLAGTPAHPAFFGRLLALRRWPFARYTESGMPDFFRTAVGADPTFAELRKPFATLGIDIVARRILVYSSRTTPQMKVSEALRIATAVPFLYPPHEKGGRIIVDGALASQCPVWLATDYGDELPIVLLRHRKASAGLQPGNLPTFLTQLVDLGGSTRDDYLVRQIPRVHPVDIDCGPILYDQFDLSHEQKEFLINQGRTAAEDVIPFLKEGGARLDVAGRGEAVSSGAPQDDDDRAEVGGAAAMARPKWRCSW